MILRDSNKSNEKPTFNLTLVGGLGKPEERRPLRDLGVDGWIILGCISRRWDAGIWTGLGWPRIETGGGRL